MKIYNQETLNYWFDYFIVFENPNKVSIPWIFVKTAGA